MPQSAKKQHDNENFIFYTSSSDALKRGADRLIGLSLAEAKAMNRSVQRPELEYLEAQFAALLPYGVSARILKAVLPLEKATDAPSWQEAWFEVIVSKSLPRQDAGNVFAFVHRLEQKPTERMARFSGRTIGSTRPN